MNEDLQEKWRAMIQDRLIDHAILDMLQQRTWAQRLNSMLSRNMRFVSTESPFPVDMGMWYIAYAIMSIRRQMDDDKNAISLRRLLEQMKANAPALVGLSPEGVAIGVDDIEADLQRLATVSERIIRIADREIAHHDSKGYGSAVRPTFNDLYECIDVVNEVNAKYRRLLTGAAQVGGLAPVEQFDWSDVFRFPWIPDCVKCHHSAVYHRKDGSALDCHGWADEWKRAGMHGSMEPCGCTITEDEVYASANPQQ